MTTASPIATGRHRRWRGGLVADESAATAVEFALVAAPFLALIVAIIQTFLVFFASQLLETAVVQASRQILTGQAQAANMTESEFAANLVCPVVSVVMNCKNLMIDVETYSAFSNTSNASSFPAATSTAPTLTYNQGVVTNTWLYNPGTTGQIVVVRVMYLWPVFGGPLGFNLANQANGTRLIMAAAAFQNEPP